MTHLQSNRFKKIFTLKCLPECRLRFALLFLVVAFSSIGQSQSDIASSLEATEAAKTKAAIFAKTIAAKIEVERFQEFNISLNRGLNISIPFFPEIGPGVENSELRNLFERASPELQEKFLTERQSMLAKVGKALSVIDYLKFIRSGASVQETAGEELSQAQLAVMAIDSDPKDPRNPEVLPDREAPTDPEVPQVVADQEKIRWTLRFIRTALMSYDKHLWSLLATKQNLTSAKYVFFGALIGSAIGKGWMRAIGVGIRYFKDLESGRPRFQIYLLKEKLDPNSVSLGLEADLRFRLGSIPLRAQDIEKSIQGASVDVAGWGGRIAVPGGSDKFAQFTINLANIGAATFGGWAATHGHPILGSVAGITAGIITVLSMPSFINTNTKIIPVSASLVRQQLSQLLTFLKLRQSNPAPSCKTLFN